jgi:hypothetical protein
VRQVVPDPPPFEPLSDDDRTAKKTKDEVLEVLNRIAGKTTSFSNETSAGVASGTLMKKSLLSVRMVSLKAQMTQKM